MKLIESSSQCIKRRRQSEHSIEEKQSTESDIENKHCTTSNKSKVDQISSSSQENHSENSGASSEGKNEEEKASQRDKNQPQLADQESSKPKKSWEAVKQPNTKRKRDAKGEEKIKDGFKGFLNLVVTLNSPELPTQTLEENEDRGDDEESKEQVSNQLKNAVLSGKWELEKVQQTHPKVMLEDQRSLNLGEGWVQVDQNGTQTGSKVVTEPAFQVGEEVNEKASQKHDSGDKQASSQKEISNAQNVPINCIRTSTKYPLVNNQCIHAKCAYYIWFIKKQQYYQEQCLKMLGKEAQLAQSLGTQVSGQDEAVRIQEINES